ncbi:BT0820 family HAD-type phosphatase [uncultured Polaribacter sp.]|uniref:BT0820 family HAD-type phosphatase n=1 Tax=uncultured Polaribacter sp. TaxID=174711 RepID=UPI00261DF845|nr:hydrolase [uncultured Polaribacter sp.]
MKSNNLIVAIDFDGTVVKDAYPKIGKPQLFAFETLRKLNLEGYRLVLWTYRSGQKLDEAVSFCKENGVEFYAINKSFPEEEFDPKYSRKINADIFVDDRNIGGFIGWTAVYRQLLNHDIKPKKKKGFLSFFK